VPRVLAAGADRARIRQIKFVVVHGVDQHFSLVRDLQALDDEYTRRPFKMLIVDPVNAYLPNVDTYRDNEVRGVLSPLTQWAERRGVAVVAIIHNGKNADRNALQRMLGSTAFGATARACYLVCRDAETDGRQLFLCSKMNIAQKPPGLAYRFEPRTVPGKGGTPVDTVGVAWELGTVKETADEALRALTKTGPQARGEAVKAIKAVLAGDPVEATEATAQIRAAGVSGSTLTRAKLDLGVRSTDRRDRRGRSVVLGAARVDPR
jgi:putative DNA primase/helicase